MESFPKAPLLELGCSQGTTMAQWRTVLMVTGLRPGTPWDLKIIWPGTWMSFSHSHAIQMILYIHIIHTHTYIYIYIHTHMYIYIYIYVCVLYTDIHTCNMYIYIWVKYGVHPSQYPSHQSKLVHFMWTNGESIILTDFNQIQSNSLIDDFLPNWPIIHFLSDVGKHNVISWTPALGRGESDKVIVLGIPVENRIGQYPMNEISPAKKGI